MRVLGRCCVKAPKQVMVLDTSFPIPDGARRKLERNGYIVLDGDPEKVRIIAAEHVGQPDLITRAALAAIQQSSFSSVQRDFAKLLIKQYLAEPKP